MCINGHWMDRECPPGMSYSAKSQVCRLDPSCAHPSKCKLDVSYNLKCDEYMICSWKNIFEHHFCPTFHRWDSEALRCIPDSNCVPSMYSFEIKLIARFCEKCILSQLRPDRITHVEKQCIDGDTSNDEENCAHYAICIDGKWKKAKCKLREMFWNQQLKRCDYSNQCKAYKQADCSHGQRLIGGVCGEYLECIHDRNVQKCVSSHNCASFHDTHLSTIDYNISMSPLSHLLTTFENDQQNLHKMTTSSSYEQPKQYCVVGSKIRDEYNCSRYFICTKNGYKVRYCKDGQKFNEESGQCDKNYHYDLSHCDDGKTLESKLCGHYQFCQDGIWHEGKCQDNRQFANGRCQEYSSEKRKNHDLHNFSLTIVKLNLMSTPHDQTRDLQGNLSTCQNGDVSVNNSDLMRYFKCINGRFREQFCENGTIFDAERGFCSKCTNCTSEKRCKEKETKASYGVSAAYYMCENGKFRSRFCPYGFVYNHDNRACLQYTATSMFEQTCKETGDSAGYRADPLDCHQFYQCANGKWVSKTCPAHLFWNPEKTICDWPDQVDLCTQRET
ncbi:unnamed protein product [Thelazia callipaeda]|uniref:Chitin-binding type-2 domain-containing protein n=1 Tax=Thelazia callipaeda TaxID=103827 RepID=A0A158RB53_THECL|nr:unnamed protein product [Thelazia callipaeda]